MEGKRMIHVFVPIMFFFFLASSSHAAMSSPIDDKVDLNDLRKVVLEELVKVVGHPNFTAGADNGDWMVKSVMFIMDKLNWKLNFTAGNDDDVEYIEDATQKLATCVSWIIVEPELNPYRSITKGLMSYGKLFDYMRSMSDVYKGKKNPIYECFMDVYATCELLAPSTLQGAVVYRFQCAWDVYEKCHLQKFAKEGQWGVPDINA